MSIQVLCPNGHPLTVSDACAGRIGLCPVCKAPVKVPQADSRPLSGDASLDFLSASASEPAVEKPFPVRGATSDPATTPKRRCSQCQREIPPLFSTCPYCRAPLASWPDTSTGSG